MLVSQTYTHWWVVQIRCSWIVCPLYVKWRPSGDAAVRDFLFMLDLCENVNVVHMVQYTWNCIVLFRFVPGGSILKNCILSNVHLSKHCKHEFMASISTFKSSSNYMMFIIERRGDTLIDKVYMASLYFTPPNMVAMVLRIVRLCWKHCDASFTLQWSKGKGLNWSIKWCVFLSCDRKFQQPQAKQIVELSVWRVWSSAVAQIAWQRDRQCPETGNGIPSEL